MITSKVTAKAQTTIPRPVRDALHVKPGDEVAYEIRGSQVILTRAKTGAEDPFATFTEWSGENDQRAYGKL